MATRTVSNAGGNWNATGTWVGGVVPIAGDDVNFTATSGNLTVNVSTANLIGITFANYVGTITFNNPINTSGFVNLGTGGYTQAGASGINLIGTTTLTSGGVTWSRTLAFSGTSITYTLAGNWTSTGTITFGGATSTIINGNTLFIGADFSVGGTAILSGTTVFNFNGTGSLSTVSGASIRNNITVNTAGTLTVSGTLNYNTGTFTYTAGTVITTGSTLNISANTTLATNGISWNNITTSGTTTIALSSNLTLTGNLTVGGTLAFTLGGNSIVSSSATLVTQGSSTFTVPQNLTFTNFNSTGPTVLNGFQISFTGNFTFISGSGTLSGTTNLVMSGTGTLQANLTVTNNLTFNTAGTITISALVYSTGTLTYTAGTIVTTGSTFTLITPGGATLNTSGMTWNNVTISGGSYTTTLTSNLNVSGTLFLSGSTLTINGNTLNISGNLQTNATTTTGTTAFLVNGTGTWSTGAVAVIRNNMTINTAGTFTLSGNVYYGTGTLTYTSGTVVTTGATLDIRESATLAINGVTWNAVAFGGSSVTNTITLSNNLTVSNLNLTANSSTITINSNTIFVNGNLTVSANTSTFSGTTTIVLNGTGTWSHSLTSPIRNNITINTGGTITIGTNIYYNTGTLTYTAGTVVTTGSTLQILNANVTLATNGITWNNITTTGTTITLSNNLTLNGTFTVSGSTTAFTLGGNTFVSANANLNVAGTFTLPANQSFINCTLNGAGLNTNTLTVTGNLTMQGGGSSGTTNIVYGGTGIWTAVNTNSTINNNFTINTAGTLTISGIVYKQTNTFTYTAGTIDDTTGTVAVQALTLNVSGFTFRKLLVNNTITLGANINATTFGTWGPNTTTFVLGGNTINFTHLELGNTGTTTLPTAWVCTNIDFNAASSSVLNGNSITINGNILQSGNAQYSGTTTLTYTGTGSWTQTGTGYCLNSFTINTAGTLTFISGNIGGGIFTYTAGTVVTTGSTLYVRVGNTTMNHGSIVWANVILGNSAGSGFAGNITLNNKLTCTNTLTLGTSSITFAGTDGTFDVYDLIFGTTASAAVATILISAKTYRVRQSLTCTQSVNANRVTLRSSVGGSQAIFTLDPGATIDVGFVNATDINSSLGRPIYSYRGVFSNTLNWSLLPVDPVIGGGESSFTFVN